MGTFTLGLHGVWSVNITDLEPLNTEATRLWTTCNYCFQSATYYCCQIFYNLLMFLSFAFLFQFSFKKAVTLALTLGKGNPL